MCTQVAGHMTGLDGKSEHTGSDGLDALDPAAGCNGPLANPEPTQPSSSATSSAIPSDQLQASLSKRSGLAGWRQQALRIGSNPATPADDKASDPHGPATANRVVDWLGGLLEQTEDTVNYLRDNLGRIPVQANPEVIARTDAAERLRRPLDAQLAAGASQADLVKATIAKRARFCTAIGGLFALPGTVPGIGTMAQFVLGMAATWPETDLVRYQLWCLQVELLHLHGMVYTKADADRLAEAFQQYDWLNKGGEAVTQRLLAGLRQSTATASGLVDRVLIRTGASAALRETAGRVLAKALPLGIGVAIGAMTNYLKLHMFAGRQTRWMRESAYGDHLNLHPPRPLK